MPTATRCVSNVCEKVSPNKNKSCLIYTLSVASFYGWINIRNRPIYFQLSMLNLWFFILLEIFGIGTWSSRTSLFFKNIAMCYFWQPSDASIFSFRAPNNYYFMIIILGCGLRDIKFSWSYITVAPYFEYFDGSVRIFKKKKK